MQPDVLPTRALNRATLARQLLLERADLPVLDAVEHLVGLQAQVPLDPYTALWSRLRGFDPASLARLLVDRRVVRTTVMRATIHLVSADDCLTLRPLVQPVLDAELARHPDFAAPVREADLPRVLAYATAFLAEQPRNGRELRAALAAEFPQEDPAALAYACRCLLPLVQVPPRGVWGETKEVTLTTAEAWLGRPLAARPSLEAVVLRYLRAFGPASVADVATWCRLTRLRAVVERLRPRLLMFRDERGRELFDVPDAPRPASDTPAPTRLLPEYDNVLLSHDEHARVVPPHRRAALGAIGGIGFGSVLHDGFVCGVWRIERIRASEAAALAVTLAERLPKRAVASVEAEARRYLRFAAPDAESREVRIVVS